MADVKLSALTAATSMATGDLLPFTSAPGGTPISKNITRENLFKALAIGSDADGDMYYRASGVLARLAAGSDGQTLVSNGTAAPGWEYQPKTNFLTNSQWMVMSGSTLENVGSNLLIGADADFSGAGTWTTDLGWSIIGGVYRATAAESAGSKSMSGLTPGKLYRFSIKSSAHTIGTASLRILTSGYVTISAGQTFTPDGSSIYSIVWKCSGANDRICIYYATTLTSDFDDASVYEVTPGYVSGTIGPDGYNLTSGVKFYRQHNDATYTKAGQFYSGKIVGDGSAGTMMWSDCGKKLLPDFYSKYAGRTVTKGRYVWCASPNKARIGITDSDGTTWSAYHSGSSTWEWLEVTRTSAATIMSWECVDDAGTSTTAWFSHGMLIFGSSIGQGNYQPIPNEVIPVQNAIFNLLSSYIPASGSTTLNIESLSNGKIGAGIKGLVIELLGKNSAANKALILYGPGSVAITMFSQVANVYIVNSCPIQCTITGNFILWAEDGNWIGVTILVNAIIT